ncbi:hypothetical protein C4D60_Mb10t09350 [Musa balbisiana]|uniref:Uncharacterized protein n=1 Tax=Musa balbisiana TaxID=52838 RepID=A0A4V4H4P7_MUSBA|nr:hypothetical protein C4D60_Mb10t09350 [Musa balbisiana]
MTIDSRRSLSTHPLHLTFTVRVAFLDRSFGKGDESKKPRKQSFHPDLPSHLHLLRPLPHCRFATVALNGDGVTCSAIAAVALSRYLLPLQSDRESPHNSTILTTIERPLFHLPPEYLIVVYRERECDRDRERG